MMDITKLAEWNPWWETGILPSELRGIERPDYHLLTGSDSIKEVTIITGVRRSGKSTLMYQMIDRLIKKGTKTKQILFINLEDPRLEHTSLDDIYESYRKHLNQENKAYIFLDEIHRVKGWEAWIRTKYDQKTKDKFIISGSSSYVLKKEYATLLTGRNITFEVNPLSFKEFLQFKNIKINEKVLKKGIMLDRTKRLMISRLLEYLQSGGFPEVVIKTSEYKKKLLEQYFDDIIYKDIVARYDLSSQKVRDLALYLANQTTGLVSLRKIRQSLELSYDTIKDYMNYFTDAFLFFTCNHFSYSFRKQKTHPSKIYSIDTGLQQAVSFSFSKDLGKMAENIVFLHLKKAQPEVYYWMNSQEVDFVIKKKDQSLLAVNVSYTNDPAKREWKGLLEFKKECPKAEELIIITEDLEKKEKGIQYMPLWKWLLTQQKMLQ